MNTQLAFGTWGFGGDAYGRISEKSCLKLLNTAFDNGISVFDTSPIYGSGRAESILGSFLKNRSDKIQVFTKVGMIPHDSHEIPYNFSSEYIETSINKSLQRLKVETIDYVQLHSPALEYKEVFTDIFETISAIEKSGKVKNFGISLRSPNYLDFQINDYAWRSIQFNFSIMDQRIKMQASITKSNFLRTLKIARTALHFGFLTQKGVNIEKLTPSDHLYKWPKEQLNIWNTLSNKFKDFAIKQGVVVENLAINYIKQSKLVDYILIGFMNVDQIHQNLSAIENSNLTKSDILSLYNLYLEIEQELKVESPYFYLPSINAEQKKNED